MHLAGDWVDTVKVKMGGRWMGPRRRGRAWSLSTVTIAADNFNAIGVSRGALVRTTAKTVVCWMYTVKVSMETKTVFVVGRHTVKVSICTNNNVYLSKANISREDKAAMLHLDPSSVGHPDKRWLEPHFPTATASVSRATSCRSSVPVCH